MKRMLLLVLLFTTACAPSQSAIQTAIAQTQAAIPTAISTSTPIALKDIKLDALLVQPGDLPAGITTAQIRSTAPAMFSGLPVADQTVFQQFSQAGNISGGATVFLYSDATKRQNAYAQIHDGMGPAGLNSTVQNVGEKSNEIHMTLIQDEYEILFLRCTAVVHIRMFIDDNASIEAYAQHLDQRLTPVVCR